MADLLEKRGFGPSRAVWTIHDGIRIWIHLSDETGQISGFWSERIDEAPRASADEVFTGLKLRIERAERGEIPMGDALMFWPAGWDCWYIGTPAPISQYMSDKFPEDAAKFSSGL